jgi:signal peptidase II
VTRRNALGVGIAALVVALDQWTKRWASESLAYRSPIDVIGELVRFTYTRNPGIAFGLGAGSHFPFWLFSVAAVFAIAFLFARHPSPSALRRLALSLILGGALGNLIDRVRFGEVVDFIEIGWGHWHWPVFNVADSAVTIGVVLFALTWSRAHGPVEPARAGAPDEASNLAERNDAGVVGDVAPRGGTVGPVPRGGADGPVA